MMNEHPYFHWDLLRQPLQTPQFGMAPSFFDVNSMLELRKEKSRDAARSRRGKENYEFYELARLLPLPAAITSQLDKASIIRLTISYLKLRDFSCRGEPAWNRDSGNINGKVMSNHRQMDMLDPFETRQGTHILQSLDGFAFILANDGRFLYISETVSIYLGLSQVEMAGSSVFDYVHQDDHSEMAQHLGMCLVSGPAHASPDSGSDGASSPSLRPRSPSEKGYVMVPDSEKGLHKSFSIRMKSTLTKRGMHVKTSGYRVVHIVGAFRPQSAFAMPAQSGQTTAGSNGSPSQGNAPIIGLVGMAVALPPPTVTELRLELDTFILRLTPDFKVTYCDPIVSDLLNLTPEDVNDRLLYDLCHAGDLTRLRQSHTDILNKGQVLTDYYRLMTKHGGYVWIQTCASILFNSKNADDQSILAINYVISDVKDQNRAMDLWQVTGDVNASMNSSSNCPLREKILDGLRLTQDDKVSGKASKTHSSKASAPNGPFDDNLDDWHDQKEKHVEGKDDDDFTSSGNSMKNSVSGQTNESTTSEITSTCSGDLKNKRRKMENPRKRRKSDQNTQDCPQPSKVLNLALDETPLASKESSKEQLKTRQNAGVTNNPERIGLSTVRQGGMQSPSPEDLSVRKTQNSQPSGILVSSRQSPCILEENRLGNTILSHEPSLVGHNSTPPNLIPMTGNSVQDLEAAMNRHLPHDRLEDVEKPCPCPNQVAGEPAMNKSQPVSSTSLTHQTVTATTWASSQKTLGMDSGNSALTASSLLRSIYATRESVIKTGCRSQPVSFLNAEAPSSLLTPPEPDPDSLPCKDHINTMYCYGSKSVATSQTHLPDTESVPLFKDSIYDARDSAMYKDTQVKDQFSFLQYKDHLSTTYIDHISSPTYKDHLTPPYKDFPQFKDFSPAFPIPSLMSPNNRIHQTYPNLSHPFPVSLPSQHVDACSITPPASNSPDVIKPPHLSQPYDPVSNCPLDNNNVYNVSNKQFSHIQFHPSSSPTNGYHYRYAKGHQQYPMGINGQDLSKSGYYGMGSSPGSSMYMDLTHNPTGQYDACPRATALPWY